MAKSKKANQTKKQVISLLVISLVCVGVAVAYQAVSHYYTGGGYISSINSNYTSGAIIGPQSQPEYEIQDLDLETAGSQVYLKWTNLGDAKTSYLVKYVEDKSSINDLFDNAAKSYTSAVGTFTKPTAKKTTDSKQYYLAQAPEMFIELQKIKKAPQAISDSGSATKSRYELSGLNKNNTYAYFVQTYYESKLVAESKKSIVFKAEEMTKTATSGMPFKDVPEDAWFKRYVKALHEKGIIEGREKYNPNEQVNRAETTKFVIKAMNIGVTATNAKYAAKKFSDVSVDDWFAPYVGYMAEKGWIQGITTKNGIEFKGSQPVKRAEALKILIAATDLNLSAYGKKASFADVKSSDWFAAHVEYAYDKGIISGDKDGKFYPSRNINRAEIAKIISIFL
ncbi:S-layer homology domain-containing protein, partial [Patescibacteria group bacterium]|nr:S-layer homology domain-containing protein [Patescibacteria group bacterium]